jgi:SAM-dependent methyltransferase
LTPKQDAYGRMIQDHHRGVDVIEIVERDDGFISTSGGPVQYFKAFKDWPRHHRLGIRWVRGRVLDIGAGAGRVALHLQNKGHAVVAVDISPGAIKIVRQRGVRHALVRPITKLDHTLGTFDTLVLFGNNFGLFGNPRRLRWLLRRFARMTAPAARIVAEVLDPYDTTSPDHIRYHRRNRALGRMGGQARIRVRYRSFATPWFEYFFVSRKELLSLLRDTQWRVERIIDSPGPTYIAVLQKA